MWFSLDLLNVSRPTSVHVLAEEFNTKHPARYTPTCLLRQVIRFTDYSTLYFINQCGRVLKLFVWVAGFCEECFGGLRKRLHLKPCLMQSLYFRSAQVAQRVPALLLQAITWHESATLIAFHGFLLHVCKESKFKQFLQSMYLALLYIVRVVVMCIHLFQKRLTWCNSEYHDRKELWAFKNFQFNQATTLWNLNSGRIR